ncbi:MAG: hypothetical protein JXM79_19135 [Sedimentisphaerales bacterium]|nr:hypothetical protein [Sedimentisphaerales bacterium]
MTQKKIDRVLTELPPFMRENIGPVKYEPFSPLSLALAGQVVETDPTATIYLYAFADEEVLRHEAFHSFELLAMHNRPIDWQNYYLCMGNMEFKLSTHLTLFSPIPPQWLPSSSSGTLYGEFNHFEDGAEVFVHHRPEKKWDCVCRFTSGLPQSQQHLKPKFAQSEPTDSPILSIIRADFHNMASSPHEANAAKRGPSDSPILSIIRDNFLNMASSPHEANTTKGEPSDSTILSIIRANYSNMASSPHEANTAKREPSDSTILSIIRANYSNMASSPHEANPPQREPTDSTILSNIQHNFQEMVLSYHQQENAER